MVEQILKLLPPEVQQRPNRSDVNVLYVGTATYDLEVRREQQTRCFVDQGFTVDSLDEAMNDSKQDRAVCVSKIETADVIVVGGGNTLFAVDRWKHLGLVPHFRKAMERNCVLTGGSAGAICWFDSGHSDSADPDTYLEPMLAKYDDNAQTGNGSDVEVDESSTFDTNNKKDWDYLRVPGMGFVPGRMICCPHHDRVQSNGLLRADDFDAMLLKRAAALLAPQGDADDNKDDNDNEDNSASANTASNSTGTMTSNPTHQIEVVGIGIDHNAAFIVEGSRYKVYSLPDKAGSVVTNTDKAGPKFSVRADGTAEGLPGVWIKRVDLMVANEKQKRLTVTSTLCPLEGDLVDLLGEDNYFGDDLCFENDDEEENRKAIEFCRRGNPAVRIPI